MRIQVPGGSDSRCYADESDILGVAPFRITAVPVYRFFQSRDSPEDVAYTIYLVLLLGWRAMRAGFYAFVSPIVALGAGAWFFGEATAGTRSLAPR